MMVVVAGNVRQGVRWRSPVMLVGNLQMTAVQGARRASILEVFDL
jgi:NaMN:DMB phosphoribosyltransferase